MYHHASMDTWWANSFPYTNVPFPRLIFARIFFKWLLPRLTRTNIYDVLYQTYISSSGHMFVTISISIYFTFRLWMSILIRLLYLYLRYYMFMRIYHTFGKREENSSTKNEYNNSTSTLLKRLTMIFSTNYTRPLL